jgi:hypothetical protein
MGLLSQIREPSYLNSRGLHAEVSRKARQNGSAQTFEPLRTETSLMIHHDTFMAHGVPLNLSRSACVKWVVIS